MKGRCCCWGVAVVGSLGWLGATAATVREAWGGSRKGARGLATRGGVQGRGRGVERRRGSKEGRRTRLRSRREGRRRGAREGDWHGPHGHQGVCRWGPAGRGVQAAAGSRPGLGPGQGRAVGPQDPLELVGGMGVQPLRRVREAAPGGREGQGEEEGLGSCGQQEQDDWVFKVSWRRADRRACITMRDGRVCNCRRVTVASLVDGRRLQETFPGGKPP